MKGGKAVWGAGSRQTEKKGKRSSAEKNIVHSVEGERPLMAKDSETGPSQNSVKHGKGDSSGDESLSGGGGGGGTDEESVSGGAL